MIFLTDLPLDKLATGLKVLSVLNTTGTITSINQCCKDPNDPLIGVDWDNKTHSFNNLCYFHKVKVLI